MSHEDDMPDSDGEDESQLLLKKPDLGKKHLPPESDPTPFVEGIGTPVSNVLTLAGTQVFLSFAYYGTISTLALFLNQEALFDEPSASFVTNATISTVFLMAVVGGILSDLVFGKYQAILLGCCLATLGYFFLWACVFLHPTPKVLPHMKSDKEAGPHVEVGVMYMGLFLISLGYGSLMPCMSSFVGDQALPVRRQNRLQESLSPTPTSSTALTASSGIDNTAQSFYRLYYVSFNVGAIAGMMIIPEVVASHSYSTAFKYIFLSALCSVPLFIWGGTRFTHTLSSNNSDESWINPEPESRERMKLVLKVFSPLVVFWALFYNIPSLWTFSATQMNRHVGHVVIPAGSMSAANPLADILLIPFFQFVLDPFIEKRNVKFGSLERIYTGMAFTAASLLMAGVLQVHIQNSMDRKNSDVSSISVLWQLPQYFLLSCGEILLSITCLEFANAQAPAHMKTVVMSALYFTQCLGNVLVALVAILHVGTVAEDYMFFAGFMFAFMGAFYLIAKDLPI